jgi:hypothetical protein
VSRPASPDALAAGAGPTASAQRADPSRSAAVRVAASTHRRRGLALMGVGAFQLWLWATRIVNLVGAAEDRSRAFVGVHLALYTAAIALGGLLTLLGTRMVREARSAHRQGGSPA